MLSMVFLYFLSTEESVTVAHIIILAILFFLTLLSIVGAAGTLIHRDKKDWVTMYRVSSLCMVISFFILIGVLLGFSLQNSGWNCNQPNKCQPGEAWNKWWDDPWNCWYVSSVFGIIVVGVFSCCWSRQLNKNETELLLKSPHLQDPNTPVSNLSDIDLKTHCEETESGEIN